MTSPKYIVRAVISQTPMKLYVGANLSGVDPSEYCTSCRPFVFDNFEAAKEAAATNTGYARELFQVTWALRWFFENDAQEYYVRPGCIATERFDARRFDSPADALSEVHPDNRYGAHGPHDKSGYRVVRLLKRVRT